MVDMAARHNAEMQELEDAAAESQAPMPHASNSPTTQQVACKLDQDHTARTAVSVTQRLQLPAQPLVRQLQPHPPKTTAVTAANMPASASFAVHKHSQREIRQ